MQPGVPDWPAFLFHSSLAEARVGADEVIILLALPHILGRGFVRFGMPRIWDRGGLNRRGGQDDRGGQW
jgi:hypothetical protein